MSHSNPYHSGELEVQMLAGRASQGAAVGRAIADHITPGAWNFLAAQSMLVLGSWDGARGAWPCLLLGTPGFATTRDGTNVRLDLEHTWSAPQDPLWKNLHHNGLISLLAIELVTRRRLRVNGHLSAIPTQPTVSACLDIIVDQAYPNCPKYIQRRILHITHARPAQADISESPTLSPDQMQLIAQADTCFVASVHGKYGTDVSHRGGHPGFVQVESPARLRIPDYAGNGMFNTLGNIHASGFAGLLFIDFENERQLQVIGDAEIDWMDASAAAERTWSLDIRHVRESSLPHGLDWEFVDFSPFNPDPSQG